jgi:hypothetical protein
VVFSAPPMAMRESPVGHADSAVIVDDGRQSLLAYGDTKTQGI